MFEFITKYIYPNVESNTDTVSNINTENNEEYYMKLYEIKFPNNIVVEAKGISPRNAFENYIYKQKLKGNYITYNYYDVSYNIQRI